MTISDDLPREYHERDLEEYRSPVDVTAPAHLRGQAVVLQDIAEERLRQVEKWGPQSHPDGTGPDLRILRRTDINLDLRTGTELANIMRARCDGEADDPATDTWVNILLEESFESFAEVDLKRLRKELIQTAAVAVAWVEDIDARRDG